jgi:chromosome partitioning protein
MIITVAHTKGGVGKSTLAWHLAHSFEEIGKTVRIIDLDFQQTLHFVNQIGGGYFSVSQAFDRASLHDVLSDIPGDEVDVYIIDIGGFDSTLNRAAIGLSDIILIPVGDSITEVLGLKTFEPIIAGMGKPIPARVVLNNIHPSKRNLDGLKGAVKAPMLVLDTVVRQRAAYRKTMQRGKSVFDIADAAPRTEIRGVRDELLRS